MIRATVFGLLAAAICACSCSELAKRRIDPPPLDRELRAGLAAWLEREGMEPVEYVTGLFDGHDVVFLGEVHRVRHDVLLVQSLIEPLHRSGVRVLATEFGRREDQPLIDSLLAAPEWNEDLAREIVFRQLVWWGYREYVDIYRAAWDLNRKLPAGAARFRILGMNDSPDWSHVRTPRDRDDPAIMRKVWRGGGEELWAGAVLDAVESGERVLVHCGIHHAFTGYRQPIVSGGEFVRFDTYLRCGNHVREALGERAITVFLHAPWNGPDGYGARLRHPANGAIDALMLAMDPRPVGFDLDGGPFGELPIGDAVYRHGYDDPLLSTFCDGWIYIEPISESVGVTPIPNWINGHNLDRARAQSPNPRFRDASAGEFNKGIARDADMPRRWRHLR